MKMMMKRMRHHQSKYRKALPQRAKSHLVVRKRHNRGHSKNPPNRDKNPRPQKGPLIRVRDSRVDRSHREEVAVDRSTDRVDRRVLKVATRTNIVVTSARDKHELYL